MIGRVAVLDIDHDVQGHIVGTVAYGGPVVIIGVDTGNAIDLRAVGETTLAPLAAIQLGVALARWAESKVK